MSQRFFEYLCCPEAAVHFNVDGGLCKKPGYFRFGKDLICFGKSSAVPVGQCPGQNLADSFPPIRVESKKIGGDILEIPVMATQDYSLFHILYQYSIDLWRGQTEIIFRGNVIISLITHPDYPIEQKV